MAESAAAQQQVLYPTKAQFDRLVSYVREILTENIALEKRVKWLEDTEQNRQRVENEAFARKRKHTERSAALESELDIKPL